MASPLLANLNPEQQAAVTLPHQSALILAGAGSGKTRVLTTRIAWLLATGQASPLSILAVTFTNKAAKEMLTRLSAMTTIYTRGMWIGTFHGLCNRLLRIHYRDANLPQLFQIIDTQDQLALIKRLYKAHNIDDERFPARDCSTSSCTPRKRAAPEPGRGARRFHAPAGRALRAVRSRPASARRVVDFAELLLRSYELLPARGLARALSRAAFRTSGRRVPGHQRAAVQVAAIAHRPHTAVFAVGDDDQSIYAFRGANIANMQQFERDFSRADMPVRLIKLEQNYRSHGNILDAANALIKQNQARLGKNLWTAEGKGEPVRAFTAGTDFDEAAFIVDVVKGLGSDGIVLSDMACSIGRMRSRGYWSTRSSTPRSLPRLWRHALFRARRNQACARLSSAPCRTG
jgi:DNA helicase-2/ATP-dependent DNA helicase PcrA